ncbi:putative transcriptional regulator, ModE family [Sulfurimonas denitrificans DSM 1251]|jgi:molybdate transport system regulatory protein|uniref:Putative transcriptional regulator, ModE family n=1 Tax=Sulfurimonas denitrificans (strain ATCC 33889 / DSM 1251) TaxID=326298 RepID=Q30QB7_SULDN|nr:TOBE domain-containing protein [Sulfurimonas denitrificans]ABB44814.1 putative transcriptional regulator, ModE family [Sulfurimonas denitrificans DSM 1251]MDD3443361.1 TOBE domain-containing protein [Sulfurimonas denitrificans]
MKIDGRFWLTKDNESFLGSGRIELLKKIENTGSINAAAKEMKMSYKAAWERINSMNKLADEPLITRTTGGKGGGGTTLTPYAYELIKTYDRLNEVHRQFIDRFAEAGDDAEHLAKILNRTFLTTSARNQIPSTINSIKINGLNADIELAMFKECSITSTITEKSTKNMLLHTDSKVYAIIKSSDINILNEAPSPNKNINIIEGVIESIEISQDSLEVAFRINENILLIALLDKESAASLKKGAKAYALINTNNIIIGL